MSDSHTGLLHALTFPLLDQAWIDATRRYAHRPPDLRRLSFRTFGRR